MNHRRAERGEGRIGTLIALMLLGAAIFVGVKIIPVRINAYEFKDFMREECRYGASRTKDEEIVKRVFQKAQELRLPLDKKNLKLERTAGEMIMSARFEVPIDLKVTQYVFRFDETERAPLF